MNNINKKSDVSRLQRETSNRKGMIYKDEYQERL